jgi:hypothetical protein
VYFSNGSTALSAIPTGTAFRVPKSGGAVTVYSVQPAGTFARSFGIAVDDLCVYWSESGIDTGGPGRVLKAAKQ